MPTDIEQMRAEFEEWAIKERIAYRDEQHRVCFYNGQRHVYWIGYQAGRAALQSQDREDAERYRWLRNRELAEGICVVHIDYWSEEYRGMAHCEVYDGESLDKAIDHARRVEEK